jgi:pimeloyl-ACP methyl ester carboxylesterase
MVAAMITPEFITLDGLRIRHASNPKGSAETVLLLSPWPESIYAFLPMWHDLARDFSLVAVDLPGFGQSDGRPDLLSPEAMGEFIVRVVAEFGLHQPHAIGPDIGTGALLFAAASHPGVFRSIVVGGGASTFPLHIDGILRTFIEAETIAPFRQTDPADIIRGSISTIRNYDVPDLVQQDYVQSYSGERFADSIAYVRSYPRDLARLSPLLPTIATPVQIIAGRDDPHVPVEDAELLNEKLSHSRLDILDCGHCAWEEDAANYGRIASEWISGGFLTT